MTNILITGGARSGKSHFAQELAAGLGEPVLFVATAEAGDDEMRYRIQQHRQARPASWRTLEVTTGIGREISRHAAGARVVIVDCITLLVNNLLSQHANQSAGNSDESLLEEAVVTEIDELLETMKTVAASFIMVTNEVGLGLVPANPVGRWYRDLLGRANQMLARQVDQVYLLVAGLPLLIKPAP